MTLTAPLGLRDRKRIETRLRLENAALTLVLRDGLEHATIEAICETAGVSNRTFFNYFQSKDDVLLGTRETDFGPDALTAHHAAHPDADAIELTIGLLVDVLGAGVGDPQLKKSRLEVAQRHPELIGKLMTQVTARGAELSAAVAELIAHTDEFRDVDAETRRTFAELLVPLCGSAIKVSVCLRPDATDDDNRTKTIKDSTELVREIAERLT